MPFASQNTVAITLPADDCVLNFFDLRDPGPTHWRLSFIHWLIIMNPSLIYSHQTQKKIIFWPKTLQQGAAYWCSGCHLLITKGFGDPTAVSLRIPKRSCKIVETLPCEMSNACAISSTWIHPSEYTRSWTFLHISSSVASSGHPALASSSKDVLLHLNSPTQN